MLLLDAYNILHVTGVLPPDLAGIDLVGLARLIARSRHAGRPAAIVCDGPRLAAESLPSGEDFPGLRTIFAGPGAEADAVIERIIDRSTAPRRLLVVSEDRRLRAAARRRRADWQGSAAFLRQLASDFARPPSPTAGFQKPETPLDQISVAAWLAEFEALDLADPASPTFIRSASATGPRPRPRNAPQPDHTPDQVKPDQARPLPAEPTGPDDPLLREAMEEWSGQLEWDDLDMRRWLGDG